MLGFGVLLLRSRSADSAFLESELPQLVDAVGGAGQPSRFACGPRP